MPKLLPHIGFAYRRRLLPALATMAALLVMEGVAIGSLQLPVPHPQESAAPDKAQAGTLPTVLSESDASLYRKAFALDKEGQPDKADEVLAQTHDPLLRGVLLGERYLYGDNEPSFSEIALWLARYGDHAQAVEVYQLARDRAPEEADFLAQPQQTATLKGFSNGHDKSVLAENKHWVSALVAFRRHDAQSALAHFKGLLKSDEDTLSSDDRAAVNFWAWRAASEQKNTAEASKYLESAADEAPGFYSILARQILGEHMAKPSGQQALDAESFLKRPPVRRAIALKAVGQDALAEKELRALFPISGSADRQRLVNLARMLDLPGAQMRMAVAGAGNSRGDATYPLPHWKPTLGYRVEPALLFAIMRQESGFNPNAKSRSGAMGVMQLMPATASAMARDARMKPGAEPAVSMSLGQHYLERLMDISAINDNLVYIIASYNAGPGNVIAWQKSLHSIDDPLLFVESIPNTQTRDYVVHVMGNYWVYSSMLGEGGNVSLAALAANRWPHYEREGKQMVSMLSRLDAGGGE